MVLNRMSCPVVVPYQNLTLAINWCSSRLTHSFRISTPVHRFPHAIDTSPKTSSVVFPMLACLLSSLSVLWMYGNEKSKERPANPGSPGRWPLNRRVCVYTGLDNQAKSGRSNDDVYILFCQAALTYAEAQMRIDDRSMNDAVTVGLRHLNELAKILKQRRQENGFVNG